MNLVINSPPLTCNHPPLNKHCLRSMSREWKRKTSVFTGEPRKALWENSSWELNYSSMGLVRLVATIEANKATAAMSGNYFRTKCHKVTGRSGKIITGKYFCGVNSALCSEQGCIYWGGIKRAEQPEEIAICLPLLVRSPGNVALTFNLQGGDMHMMTKRSLRT